MGFGVPVVATSIAVEGTELCDREDILVADEPEDFAEALIKLYESEELWRRLSENGVRKTRAFYSVQTARKSWNFCLAMITWKLASRRRQRGTPRLLSQRKTDPGFHA